MTASSATAVRAPRGNTPSRRFERVLKCLEDVTERAGSAFDAACPLHPHTGPQLRGWSDASGKIVLDCEQGCRLDAIALSACISLADVIERPIQIEKSDAPSGEVQKPRFKLLTDVELEQMPPIEFLIDGVLPTAGLGAIYGAPGAGKSFLALDMACSVAAGAPWLGRRTKRGSVVYVAAEGSAGLCQRLNAWKKHQGIEGCSLPIYFLTEPANLLASADLASLLLAFAAMPEPPSLVIIDTLHRSMPGGDENSAKDVGLVIEHADRLRRTTNSSVLLVHHTAKGAEVERGSSSLRGAVDALLFARSEDGRRELRCEKAKDWPAFETIPFELLLVEDSCVVSSLKNGDTFAVESLTPKMRDALTILSRDFPTKGATVSEWLAATEMSKPTFYRTRGQLVREGYVTEPTAARGGAYRATESGRTAVGLKSHEGLTKVSEVQAALSLMVSHPFRGETDESEAPRLVSTTVPSSHPCTACGKFSFPRPGVVCFGCKALGALAQS